LESDRAWEVAIEAVARVRKRSPQAGLTFGRTGPIAGLVRSQARSAGLAGAVTFLDDVSMPELFAGIDLLVVPSGFDGLPYALIEALVDGVPVIGADVGGIADTLAPYAGWLVPDDARGFAAGIDEAWLGIDEAWRAAQAQRVAAVAAFSPETLHRDLLSAYERMATEPTGTTPVAGVPG
jgi:glycosyltransferase involved in cell wall biosynthesis